MASKLPPGAHPSEGPPHRTDACAAHRRRWQRTVVVVVVVLLSVFLGVDSSWSPWRRTRPSSDGGRRVVMLGIDDRGETSTRTARIGERNVSRRRSDMDEAEKTSREDEGTQEGFSTRWRRSSMRPTANDSAIEWYRAMTDHLREPPAAGQAPTSPLLQQQQQDEQQNVMIEPLPEYKRRYDPDALWRPPVALMRRWTAIENEVDAVERQRKHCLEVAKPLHLRAARDVYLEHTKHFGPSLNVNTTDPKEAAKAAASRWWFHHKGERFGPTETQISGSLGDIPKAFFPGRFIRVIDGMISSVVPTAAIARDVLGHAPRNLRLSTAWLRFWVQVYYDERLQDPRCMGGDNVEVSVESESSLGVADRVVDRGFGMYEVFAVLGLTTAQAALSSAFPLKLCAGLRSSTVAASGGGILEWDAGALNLAAAASPPPPAPQQHASRQGNDRLSPSSVLPFIEQVREVSTFKRLWTAPRDMDHWFAFSDHLADRFDVPIYRRSALFDPRWYLPPLPSASPVVVDPDAEDEPNSNNSSTATTTTKQTMKTFAPVVIPREDEIQGTGLASSSSAAAAVMLINATYPAMPMGKMNLLDEEKYSSGTKWPKIHDVGHYHETARFLTCASRIPGPKDVKHRCLATSVAVGVGAAVARGGGGGDKPQADKGNADTGRQPEPVDSNSIRASHTAPSPQRGAAASKVSTRLPSCRRTWNPNAFRHGHWTRLLHGKCDGIICSGDASVLKYPQEGPYSTPPPSPFPSSSPEVSSAPWVWTSEHCVPHFYTPQEAWTLLNRLWILAWGDSTFKQSMSNFMEGHLGVPVFHVFMHDLAALKAFIVKQSHSKHAKVPEAFRHLTKAQLSSERSIPNFFAYRMWEADRLQPLSTEAIDLASSNDTSAAAVGTTLQREKEMRVVASAEDSRPQRRKQVRMTMIWGGCPGVSKRMTCRYDMGTRNRATIRILRDRAVRAYQLAHPPLTAPNISNTTIQQNVSANGTLVSEGSTTSSSVHDNPTTTSTSPPPTEAPASHDAPNETAYHYLPDVLLLNHFHWRYPATDERDFLTSVDDAIDYILQIYIDVQQPLPLMLFWSSTVRAFTDSTIPMNCAQIGSGAFDVYLTERLERHLLLRAAAAADDVLQGAPGKNPKFDKVRRIPGERLVVIGRFALTYPFHFDDRYVHSNVHYGSSLGMCATSPGRYDASQCIKDTTTEQMVNQLMLNAIEAHTAPFVDRVRGWKDGDGPFG